MVVVQRKTCRPPVPQVILINDQTVRAPPLVAIDHELLGTLGDRRAATLLCLLAQMLGEAIEGAAPARRVHSLVCRS